MSWEKLLHTLIILAAVLPLGAVLILLKANGKEPGGDESGDEHREAQE